MPHHLLTNTAHETIARIEYVADGGYVAAHWRGYISAEELRGGLIKELELCIEQNCPYLLHNRRNTYATPTILQSWLENDYMPHVAASPIRYVAYIKPNNYVSGLSSVQALSGLRQFGIEFGVFDHPREGVDWLMGKKAEVPNK